MPPDYTTGLREALWLAGIGSAALGIVGLVAWYMHPPYESGGQTTSRKALRRAGWLVGGPFGVVLFCILLFIGLAPPLFAITNFALLLSREDVGPLISQEVASGVLPLRIASLLVAWHTLWFGLRGTNRKPTAVSSESAEEVEVLRQEAYWAQGALYLLCTGILWSCVLLGVDTTETRILNWAFFFVVDDWVIVSQYASFFRVVIKSHMRRLDCLNVLLAILVLRVAWVHLYTWVFVGCLVLVYFLWQLSLAGRGWDRVPVARRQDPPPDRGGRNSLSALGGQGPRASAEQLDRGLPGGNQGPV